MSNMEVKVIDFGRRNAIAGLEMDKGKGTAVSVRDSKISNPSSAAVEDEVEDEETRRKASLEYRKEHFRQESMVDYFATDEKVDIFFRKLDEIPYRIDIRQRQLFGEWCDRFGNQSPTTPFEDAPAPEAVNETIAPAVAPPPVGETWDSIEAAKKPSKVTEWKEWEMKYVPFKLPSLPRSITTRYRKIDQKVDRLVNGGRRYGKGGEKEERIEMMPMRRLDGRKAW